MLNPFALFLYLEPIRRDLENHEFVKVLFKSTLMSFVVCLFFLMFGELLFENFFQIHFESFRFFGGVIMFTYSFLFIVQGKGALIQTKSNLDDIASNIALPFMIGAGTISLSILLARDLPLHLAIVALAVIFALNMVMIVFLKEMRETIEKRIFRRVFDRQMEFLLRINGFFVGALGVDMVVTSIHRLFF